MKFNKTAVLFLSCALVLSFVDAGTLKGHVSYIGRPFGKKPLKLNADPVCGSSHSGKVYYESFKLAADGSMEETLIYLKKVHYDSKPSQPVILDQKGCIYEPHIFGIVAGQELLIKNSDATMHNIHSMPNVNKSFNFSTPNFLSKKSTFATAEPDPFYIKCDVHPWMKAWVLVSDHPYFAVTDEKGNYSIEGIPSGTYEVVCWQEKFAAKKKFLIQNVTITDGETVKNFVLKGPKPKPK